MAHEPDESVGPETDEVDDLDDPVEVAENTIAPPEETAIHLVDEDAGGFDSEVDDPDLAAAYEIDPDVER